MKIKILFILPGVVSILASCAISKDTDFSQIKLDMTKEEFLNINLDPRIIGSKNYNNGLLEIYERIDFRHRPIESQRHYWFYFYDEKLEEWGPKENFIPNEYDKYYKEYIRKKNIKNENE